MSEKHILKHIGIIMDGNGRWAKERNLPVHEGHLRGYEKMLQIPHWFFSKGVKVLSVFAFSAENWKKVPEEINYLLKILKQAIAEEADKAVERNYQILFSGRLSELPGDLPEACNALMDQTKGNKDGILNICLNYGGREELVDAIRKMIKAKIEEGQVHEGMIRKYLYNGDLEDPEVIVRMAGEHGAASFLLWQAACSDFITMKKYWPEFEPGDVEYILGEYLRKRS